MTNFGPVCFGLVMGFITYRTLRRKKDAALSDIAAVIGALGGGAVLALFPSGTDRFDFYALGLAVGFFAYLGLSFLVEGRATAATFLGDS